MLGSTITNASPDIVQAIIDSATRNGVPVNVALGIAAHESGFNPNATNKNTNGTTDWGVMQLNDVTVQTLGVSNPLDPIQNIEAGVSLIGQYIRKYGDVATALWAYASGPGAVAKGNMNPTASGFVNYVTSYDPGLVAGATADGSGDGSGINLDTSGSYTGTVSTYTAIAIGAIIIIGIVVIANR